MTAIPGFTAQRVFCRRWRRPILGVLAALGLMAAPWTAHAADAGLHETNLAECGRDTGQNNLRLVLSLDGVVAPARVRVNVMDADGRIIVSRIAESGCVAGLLIPGAYTLTATYGSNTQTQPLTVTGGARLLAHFQWSDSGERQKGVLPVAIAD